MRKLLHRLEEFETGENVGCILLLQNLYTHRALL